MAPEVQNYGGVHPTGICEMSLRNVPPYPTFKSKESYPMEKRGN